MKHSYEVQFLMITAPIGQAAHRVHIAGARAVIDPGDPAIKLDDLTVHYLEATEFDEDDNE